MRVDVRPGRSGPTVRHGAGAGGGRRQHERGSFKGSGTRCRAVLEGEGWQGGAGWTPRQGALWCSAASARRRVAWLDRGVLQGPLPRSMLRGMARVLSPMACEWLISCRRCARGMGAGVLRMPGMVTERLAMDRSGWRCWAAGPAKAVGVGAMHFAYVARPYRAQCCVCRVRIRPNASPCCGRSPC
jgi:hypothetical protein